MKTFKVNVNDKSYVVEVEEVKYGYSFTAAVKPAQVTANIKKVGDSKKKAVGGSFIIKAPLPGLIVEVAVESGKAVKQGEKVLVLEAMKMENAILTPVSGIVDKINVRAGDSVNSNQEMIVITF